MSDESENEEIDNVEFDFSIPLSRSNQNLYKRHEDLRKLLFISSTDQYLQFIFKTLISLCDPFTQPEEREFQILSVDCLSDLLISIVFQFYHENEATEDIELESIKFEISTHFFCLLQQINKLLNAEDELNSRYIDNDEKNYIESVKYWTPKISNEFNLKLLYSMVCVLLLSIYKLTLIEDSNNECILIMTPYLHYFLKLWKCHTNIILLGLEIDRRIEFQNHETGSENETPMIIQQTLKGSSSIRYVLAWILNQNPSSVDEEEEDSYEETLDLQNETISNFIQPLARKKVNGGAISIDMRLVIIALLILYSGTSFTVGQYDEDDVDEPSKNDEHANRRFNRSKKIAEIGDILIDLEYADRFDEDIKYMLEYEFDEEDAAEDENEENSIQEDMNDDLDHNEASEIDFDEFGRDWRDIPRGENRILKPKFLEKMKEFNNLSQKEKELSEYIRPTMFDLSNILDVATENSLENRKNVEAEIGRLLVYTISKAVKDDHIARDEDTITPASIYEYFTSSASEAAIEKAQNSNKSIVPIFNITNFELFLLNNPRLARSAMDEMLMCPGYRRLLIWFITHDINLSPVLIDYVFQLAAKLRGNKSSDYEFSRQGDHLVLSDVELSMLLHEFLTNSSVYLSATTDGIEIDNGYKVVLAESIAKKLMQMLCLMINQLINLNIIKLDESDTNEDIHYYNNELRILLVNWIGKVPEARQLFFKIKNTNYEDSKQIKSDMKDKQTSFSFEDEVTLIKQYESLSVDEVAHNLQTNPNNLNIIKSFAKRIEIDLLAVLNSNIKTTNQITLDFKIFIDNFNTLCKIEELAEILFDKFEPVVSSGLISKFGQINQMPDFISSNEGLDEAEFSADFLNGDVNFDSSKNDTKKSKKKKKKLKKK